VRSSSSPTRGMPARSTGVASLPLAGAWAATTTQTAALTPAATSHLSPR
jgi:hypothetical protein